MAAPWNPRNTRLGKKLPGLKRDRRGGRTFVYYRATGERLPDLPEDHPDFVAAYERIMAGQGQSGKPQKIVKDSVADVARRLMRSHAYRSLSPDYRDVLRRDIDRLLALKEGAIARLPFALVRAKHIAAQMEGMAVNPANTRLKSWRQLSRYAEKAGIITAMPTDGLKQITGRSGDGHIPWTFSEIATYRAYWPYGTAERLAFELQYWVGSRISDTVGLGPNHVDDEGWLVFVQGKTNVEVSVPFDRDLPRFAVAEDLEHLKRAIAAMGPIERTFLQTVYGLPRSRKGARQWFSRKARQAGVPAGRTSHGLRKSRMIRHAERGASMKQIAAWSGHESLKEIARYVRRADKRRMLSPDPLPAEDSVLTSGDFL